MADEGGASEGGSSRSSPEFGERIGSIETRLTQLTTLITSLVSQQGEGGESSASVAAPGGSGPEAGTHLRDATGRTAGSTGRTQGLSMSSVGVGSTSGHTLGLNPSASAVDRSSAGAAGFGSIGMGSGAFNSQSSVPPPPTASSEWWGHVASGNTLIPGAGVMNETGESLGRNPFKVPKAPVFDGT